MSRVLLSGELIPSGRAAPDLLSVQKLVHAFIDSHSALQAKISALHSLTTEQLNEITRLKQEMTLVCTGQKTHTPNSNQVSQITHLMTIPSYHNMMQSYSEFSIWLAENF